jgi:hypothetical protein
MTGRGGWLGLDRATWLGVAVVVLVAAALRLAAIGAHLPQLVQPDEPTTFTRAQAILDGQLTPPLWDWPPGGAAVDAAVLAGGEVLGAPTTTDPGTGYLWSRAAFALIGVLVVPVTALLAGRLSPAGRARRTAALGAAGIVAVSFVLVRLSRQVHPDPLQSLFVAGAVLAALHARTHDRVGASALAGGLAGLAAAMKFVGGLVVLPVVGYLLLAVPAPRARRLVHATAATVGSMVAFVVATLGTAVTDLAGVVDGITWQFGMQSDPRLGYEGTDAAAPWLLGEVLPGALGWPLALGALAGLAWMLWRRRVGDPLLVAAATVLLAFPLLSSVRFPHYVLPALPLLAVAAAVGLGDLVASPARWARPAGVAAAAVAVAGLWLPVSGVLGLLASARGQDTREQATAWLAAREDPSRQVWAEAYALANEPDVYTASVPRIPWQDCGCLYVLSSYNEDRYQRLPDTYADELAQYADLREQGEVVATFSPSVPLSYRWNLLPQWGIGALWAGNPAGDTPLVTGPEVTILRVPGPDAAAG